MLTDTKNQNSFPESELDNLGCKASQDSTNPFGAVTPGGFSVFWSDATPCSHPGSGAEPRKVEDCEDLPEAAENSREDRIPIQLETRGITSHAKQSLLFAREVVWQQSLLAKLKGAGQEHLAGKMQECHTLQTFRRCCGCRKTSSFWNRCDLFFCPVCAPRRARERKKEIEWWVKEIAQPKHIVLTVRNSDNISRDRVTWLKDSLAKLRRNKIFRAVRGGFYSLEVTNESRGWHLHLHILADVRYISQSELAIVWGKIVGQDFAIVKVKDCRGADYLAEVTKYLMKGSELASWSGTDIADFIRAFTGLRTFGVFGSLYGKRTEWSEWIATIRDGHRTCDCGCSNWKLLSPDELTWTEQTIGDPSNAPAPPSDIRCPIPHHPELNLFRPLPPK